MSVRPWVKRFCECTDRCFFKAHGRPAWSGRKDAIPVDWYCPVHSYLDYTGADYE